MNILTLRDPGETTIPQLPLKKVSSSIDTCEESLTTPMSSSFDSHSVGGSISSSGTDWSSLCHPHTHVRGHKTVAVKLINPVNSSHASHTSHTSHASVRDRSGSHKKNTHRRDWDPYQSGHQSSVTGHLNSPPNFTSQPLQSSTFGIKFPSVTSLGSLASNTSLSSLTNAINSDHDHDRSNTFCLASPRTPRGGNDDEEDAIADAGGLDNLIKQQSRGELVQSPSSAFDDLSVGSGSIKTLNSSRSVLSALSVSKKESSHRYKTQK